MKYFSLLLFSTFYFGINSINAQIIESIIHSSNSITTIENGGSGDWNKPTNIMLSDNSFASTTSNQNGTVSEYIVASQFNFNIPTSATITGVKVMIEKEAIGEQQEVKDEVVKLVKNGMIIGENYAFPAIWENEEFFQSYGGSDSKWGTSLNVEDVNNGEFGIALSVRLNGVGEVPSAKIDYIGMVVYYIDPLPIKLTSFQIKKSFQNMVLLEWTTSSEINNDYFEIERSIDGKKWEKRGQVDGVGNSNQLNHYAFNDHLSSEKWFYYRLKQIDFNGQYEYSPIEAVENNKVTDNNYFYPNPSSGVIHYEVDDTIGKVKIFDTIGKLLLQHSNHEIGVLSIDLSTIGKGVFLAQIESKEGETVSVQRIVNK